MKSSCIGIALALSPFSFLSTMQLDDAVAASIKKIPLSAGIVYQNSFSHRPLRELSTDQRYAELRQVLITLSIQEYAAFQQLYNKLDYADQPQAKELFFEQQRLRNNELAQGIEKQHIKK